jgi:hypothetical protein
LSLLIAAGLQPPPSFEGQDLLRVLSGGLAPRADIFSQYFGGQTGLYSCRMVRDRVWKYVWNCASAEDELYHLPGDPGEIHNRIGEAALQPEIRRLRARLIAGRNRPAIPSSTSSPDRSSNLPQAHERALSPRRIPLEECRLQERDFPSETLQPPAAAATVVISLIAPWASSPLIPKICVTLPV